MRRREGRGWRGGREGDEEEGGKGVGRREGWGWDEEEGGMGMGWGGGWGGGRDGMGEEGEIRRKRSSRTCIASRSIPGVVLVQAWYLTASTRAFSPSSEISLPGNEVGVWVFGVTCIPSLECLRDSAKLTKVAFPVRCGHPSLSTTPSRRGCGCSAMSSCSRKHPMELKPCPLPPPPPPLLPEVSQRAGQYPSSPACCPSLWASWLLVLHTEKGTRRSAALCVPKY